MQDSHIVAMTVFTHFKYSPFDQMGINNLTITVNSDWSLREAAMITM